MVSFRRSCGYFLEKYLKEAVTPCSDARLPTSYRCAGVRRVYGDLRPRGVSFDCCSNSALASSIAFAGTFSLSGPGRGQEGLEKSMM